ncbi:formylglycine-generating enzyme family protein [Microseira wollei]|uniref:Sulfatase-modifying factor enzyme-like domain-containing protein n=1 Tax=Microseira wollei NIES-4236 TaxID=2530354 RepID=A0AAV3XNC1_9CYAN|nr:formylglycine-generating enzyme family protein [Microseira wollei]GET41977.1 hypothetical protein MiSe_67910 [Microseira wollei NIES-4236]
MDRNTIMIDFPLEDLQDLEYESATITASPERCLAISRQTCRGIQGQYRQETTEVAQFPANQFGLYDMHGNLWEWCEDDWHDNYKEAPSDGSAWVESDRTKTRLLVRGGSWNFIPQDCRSAFRFSVTRDIKDNDVGFRVLHRVES